MGNQIRIGLLVACCLILLSSRAFSKDMPEVGGRVMYDIDVFNGIYSNVDDPAGENSKNDTESNSELRRAQLYIKSKVGNNWSAKLEVAFDDGEEGGAEIKDGYLRYKGWKMADLTLGKLKEPFGLENSISSKHISTIERSAATTAFSPGRNVGAVLSFADKKQSWGVGIFESGVESDETQGASYALTGRYTVSPINDDRRLLHIGFSGSVRDWDGGEYEIQQPVEVHLGSDVDFGPKVNADSIRMLGLESAWVQGALSLQGELFRQQVLVSDKTVDQDAQYSGYYLQISYFLTGESKSYRKGQFTRIKPNKDSGAWELVARVSELDGVDNHDGTVSNTSLFGITYYVNTRIRVISNVLHTEFSGPDVNESRDDSGSAASFRVQYAF